MHTLTVPSQETLHYLGLEEKYGAHNYHPLPVVLTRGAGSSGTVQESQLSRRVSHVEGGANLISVVTSRQ